MKILMLGDSQVGKTTLMVSTYGMMSSQKFKGFQIKCKDNQAHDKLMMAYQKFCRTGKYPDATSRMEAYDYDFFSNGEWVIHFTLTDIRGESIRDYNTQILRDKIQESDAVMLFFDGRDAIYGTDTKLEEILLDLMPLLNSSFETDSKERMLMLIYTKIDCIPDFNQEHWERILDFSKRFTDMAQRNQKLTCQIVPTACAPNCMMDLDFMMVSLMLFGYGSELLTHQRKLEAELQTVQEMWGSGFWRELKWWTIGDKKRKEAVKRAEILSGAVEHFNHVMTPKFQELQKFYDDYQLFTVWNASPCCQDPFVL